MIQRMARWVKARPWPSILEFYRSISKSTRGEWVIPMLELVEKIAAANFAQQLYPITSMHTLCISNLPEFDFEREMLRIDFDPKARQFKLEYQETCSPLYKRWRKTCSPEQVFPSIVRFLKLKNWCRP
jgi:hypothetical protein